MPNFVVLGSNGIVGNALVTELNNRGVACISINRNNLDITNNAAIEELVKGYPDSIFVNCIAFMPADKCEQEIVNSKIINSEFVYNISRILQKNGKAKFIQLSSDFVFDGEKGTQYLINDLPNPLNIYGQHKFEAEKATTNHLGENSRIIRFASLVAKTQSQSSFIEKITARANEYGEIAVVDDLKISVASMPLILENVINAFEDQSSSIYHVVHEGVTTWFDLAKLALDVQGIKCEIRRISHLDLNLPARRPLNSSLQPKVSTLNGNWSNAVEEYLKV